MFGSWIDHQGFKSDIVLVTGAQMKEHKFHHTNLFAATNIPSLPLLETSNDFTQPFNPRILTATSGAANAGLNSRDVYGAGCAKFPPTLVDVLQEKGRAGRHPTASAATAWYLVCLSLETYMCLLFQAADPSTAKYNTNNIFLERTLLGNNYSSGRSHSTAIKCASLPYKTCLAYHIILRIVKNADMNLRRGQGLFRFLQDKAWFSQVLRLFHRRALTDRMTKEDRIG
jgi:hypothetical protein